MKRKQVLSDMGLAHQAVTFFLKDGGDAFALQ